ncbi:MAG: TetR/AcrR family transcriptional regulator [Holophaga sp.]|nr:TetR/AcrR family transcriptional regulator [Holophaga sp.]
MAEKGDITRARILDEAVRVASRDGLAGLSIGVLATVLGMSKSGLFAHFGSKEALQIAALEHAAAQVQERTAPAGRMPPGPEQLRFLFRAIQGWIDDPELPGGCPITGACIEFDDQDGPVREALVRIQRSSMQGAVAMFDRFADPALDREQLAFEFRAICLAYHHAARLLREPKAGAWARNALEALIQRALGPAEAKPRAIPGR